MTAHKVGDHVEVDQEGARAGQTGMGVRYILIIGTILVVAGFGLVALWPH